MSRCGSSTPWRIARGRRAAGPGPGEGDAHAAALNGCRSALSGWRSPGRPPSAPPRLRRRVVGGLRSGTLEPAGAPAVSSKRRSREQRQGRVRVDMARRGEGGEALHRTGVGTRSRLGVWFSVEGDHLAPRTEDRPTVGGSHRPRSVQGKPWALRASQGTGAARPQPPKPRGGAARATAARSTLLGIGGRPTSSFDVSQMGSSLAVQGKSRCADVSSVPARRSPRRDLEQDGAPSSPHPRARRGPKSTFLCPLRVCIRPRQRDPRGRVEVRVHPTAGHLVMRQQLLGEADH